MVTYDWEENLSFINNYTQHFFTGNDSLLKDILHYVNKFQTMPYIQ